MTTLPWLFPCRMFNEGKSHSTFTKVGFRDWKHATGKRGMLTVHDKCSTHLKAMVAWSQYKLNAKHNTSIAERMESSRAQAISNNRHYLKALIEVILFCAVQEISLRGHTESCEAPNQGNVLEILHLLAAHDPIVQQRLEKGPRNALYTSAEIQNTLLHIMGGLVRKKVCTEVKDAEFYFILADETKDCSKTEQMAVVVRYVDAKEARIHERFLTFEEASYLDACSLTEYILDTLRNYHLNLESIQGCIQDFCQGGANLEYVKKRGGEAVRSCRAAAGGLGIQGGARITQRGGANSPPPPLYTPLPLYHKAMIGTR